MLLFFASGNLEANIEQLQAIKNSAAQAGFNKSIRCVALSGGRQFSPYLLRKSTHFITTREMVTVEALDFLYDTDVKIISALDDRIFK